MKHERIFYNIKNILRNIIQFYYFKESEVEFKLSENYNKITTIFCSIL